LKKIEQEKPDQWDPFGCVLIFMPRMHLSRPFRLAALPLMLPGTSSAAVLAALKAARAEGAVHGFLLV